MQCSPNIITANFSGGRNKAKTAWRHQWDHGQVLCVTGIDDLPLTFTAHFSVHKEYGAAQPVEGIDGQVEIPDIWLTFGKAVYCWIYLTDGESGETVYTITIPVIPRPMPEYYEMEDTGVFDAVVAQVGEYAETAQTAADNAGASASAAAESASAAATSADNAAGSASAAAQSRTDAGLAATAASNAAQDARRSANAAAEDAGEAAQSAGTALTYRDAAQAAATEANNAKADAVTAADRAESAATAAGNAASGAGQAASAAVQSASAAAGSATTAQDAAQTATTKAGEASASATAAAASETAAQAAQTAAETAETNAGQSASTATTKAAEAAQSASNAAASETAAEAAATRAEQAAASLTVDDALSDTSTNPVQNKVVTESVTQLKSALAASQIVNSASGAIASFPDGAAMPVRSLTVAFEPIQDLNGQASPYPGGGGKNLLDEDTVYGAYKQTDGSFILTGSQSIGIRTAIPEKYIGQAMTFSAVMRIPDGSTITNIRAAARISGVNKSGGSISDSTYAKSSVTFTPETAEDVIFISYGSNGGGTMQFYDVQWELGSTATDYAPYENICPITGRDAVTVTRTGVNLLDASHLTEASGWALSTDEGNTEYNGVPVYKGGTRELYTAFGQSNRYYPIPGGCFKENTQYSATFWWKSTGSTENGIKVGFRYTDGTSSVHGASAGSVDWKRQTHTSTSGKTVKDLYFTYNSNYAFYMAGFAVVEASEFDANENTAFPSNMEFATVQLGQTVYGGTVDVTTGAMTVTHAIKTYDGTQPWSLYNTANGFALGVPEMLSGYRQFGVSNWLKNLRTSNDGVTPSFWLGVNNTTLYVLNVADLLSEYTNEAWYAYLAEHPLQVYIPLATPLTIQLTPAQLTTLKGQNNVWSDADSVTVDYVADTKLYIERLTEPDADMVTDSNIVNGQYFMVGNSLYLATANIASGANIVPGVNCTKTNLAEALNAINA